VIKQLRQVAGVRQVKVVDFKKGLFALTPQAGSQLSESAISSAVTRSGFSVTKIVAPTNTKGNEPADSSPGGPFNKRLKEAEVTRLLLAPRKAFRKADYKKALELTDALVAHIRRGPLKQPEGNSPRRNEPDAEIDQFHSLALFALGKYAEAAKAAHLTLHRGDHWNWKTLSGHYQKSSDYSSQLRNLENSIRKKSTPDKRFLIGYHYLMLGQPKAARAQFERVAKAEPGDKLVTKLLQDLGKEKNQ